MDKVKENLELNAREINDGSIVLKSYPKRMIATLSTRCNSRCIMCEVVKKQWDMPQTTMKEIESLLPYMQSVNWQGGEVFLLETFEKLFIESLNNKHLHQTIVTNGMLLNDKWIDLLTEANIELTISIDGLDKDVYERIRYGSKFDVLIRNINKLNDVRKKKNSKLSLKMHTVVMKSNYKYADMFIDFAQKYNFDIVYMMPIWGGQNIEENIYIGENREIISELSKKIETASEKSRQSGIKFFHSLPVIKEEKTAFKKECVKESVENKSGGDCSEKKTVETEHKIFCYLPWQQLNIDPGGEVRPGCLCSKPVGNIEHDSILNIWNSPDMQEYRKRVLGNPQNWCNNDCLNGSIPEDLRRI
ncbi:MAG: radical SAM protein [Endomicrobiaceae bacterium]|nr:radical SAM protein [Endomicrobiaceae bacterium]